MIGRYSGLACRPPSGIRVREVTTEAITAMKAARPKGKLAAKPPSTKTWCRK